MTMRSHVTLGVLLAGLGLGLAGCPDRESRTATPPESGSFSAVDPAVLEGQICDSSQHETTSFAPDQRFDLSCAVGYLQAAGCDFDLDPDGDGKAIPSSTIEDLHNAPGVCQKGGACSGCTDGDSLDTVADCPSLAAMSYFTAHAWSDLAAQCPEDGGGPVDPGCTIEGLAFSAEERDCAFEFFASMTCESCREVLDSRACEDAIDDAAQCQVGDTCTGCDDGDTRDDGVTCDEIAAYSYIGPAAAQALYIHISTHPCADAGEPVEVEGVSFTPEEAAAVLAVTNGASQAQLDDEAGLDHRAAENIVADRPIATLEQLAAVSYVGASALQKLKDYAAVWVPEDEAPVPVTLTTLADEAVTHGTASTFYGKTVIVDRAIVTSEPYSTNNGVLFFAADPPAGDVEQLKIYVTTGANQDTSFLSAFDDVALTGRFIEYQGTFEILVDDPAAHAIALNTSGLAYDDYDAVEAAWHGTAANPEGVVRTVATFGYTYMVPLPVFLDHPMWNGNPPGPPSDSGNEQDHNWNIAANQAIDAWQQTQ